MHLELILQPQRITNAETNNFLKSQSDSHQLTFYLNNLLDIHLLELIS